MPKDTSSLDGCCLGRRKRAGPLIQGFQLRIISKHLSVLAAEGETVAGVGRHAADRRTSLMTSRCRSGRGLPQSTTLSRSGRRGSPAGFGLRPPAGALATGAGRNAGVRPRRGVATTSHLVVLSGCAHSTAGRNSEVYFSSPDEQARPSLSPNSARNGVSSCLGQARVLRRKSQLKS